MPLIAKTPKQDLVLIKAKVPASLKEEIQAYCQWADIGDMSYFLSEAAQYVLKKDKDWRAAKQNQEAVA